MKKPSILTVALIVAVALWLLSLGPFLHLSRYDPYRWASPGQFSDLSRSLYLERRDLYVWEGMISFLAACALRLLKFLAGRWRRGALK